MAVNWLKGLVAPVAFGQQQPQQQPNMGGMPGQDAPPIGGGQNPYGVQQPMGQQGMGQQGMGMGMGQQPPMQQQMPGAMPGAMPDLQPMQWSTGTRTVGQAGQGSQAQGGAGATGSGLPSGSISGSGPASLEARCAELQHDVASLALFARALLTLLEEKKVVSREEFIEVKNRLDMLDGKMDDR